MYNSFFFCLKSILLIMLLQLSHFCLLFIPSALQPPTSIAHPPLSSCPWVIHIRSLASPFPTLFLISPCLFCVCHLCFLFPIGVRAHVAHHLYSELCVHHARSSLSHHHLSPRDLFYLLPPSSPLAIPTLLSVTVRFFIFCLVPSPFSPSPQFPPPPTVVSLFSVSMSLFLFC